MVKSVLLIPEFCAPGYTLLTETACKKGVFAIGGKDSFLVIKVEVVVRDG